MALPRVNTPTYELKIPSTGQKVKYRPFLVKEEKILLMAMEDGKPNTMSKAMQDIISACTEGDLALKNLSPFDLEYFFLQIRGKSVGDIIDLTFRKPDSIECGEKNENCQEVCNIQINIDDIKVDTKRIKNSKIELSDSIGIKMNYPQFDMIQKFANLTDQTAKTDDIFKVINECIEYIWDGDEIYKAKDATKKELTEFIESLSSSQFAKIKDFLEGMPTLRHTVTWKCSKCERQAPLLLEGIDAFFE